MISYSHTHLPEERQPQMLKGNRKTSTRCRILGCPLDNLWPAQVLSRVHDAIRTSKPVRVEGLNVAKIIQARRDPALMAALEEAEIVHLDGVGVTVGARLLGLRPPPRRTGCDLMLDLMPQAAREGYRVYFLGATHDVVSEMTERLRSSFPGLRVVGARDGYFEAHEEPAVVSEIRSKRADLLFVGISSPQKELFINRWWQSLEVKASLGVGGSFDVISGRIKRAPTFMQRLGLEWLFRLCQEPRRLAPRYISTNATFAALLLREVLGLNGEGPPPAKQ
jgi:N-acetylglucosaminyldiphosphoundecaprenol N-acetyl-beta-D-mannosaminyltransferase